MSQCQEIYAVILLVNHRYPILNAQYQGVVRLNLTITIVNVR